MEVNYRNKPSPKKKINFRGITTLLLATVVWLLTSFFFEEQTSNFIFLSIPSILVFVYRHFKKTKWRKPVLTFTSLLFIGVCYHITTPFIPGIDAHLKRIVQEPEKRGDSIVAFKGTLGFSCYSQMESSNRKTCISYYKSLAKKYTTESLSITYQKEENRSSSKSFDETIESFLSLQQFDYEKPLHYLEKAKKLAEDNLDQLGQVSYLIAMNHFIRGNMDTAELLLKKLYSSEEPYSYTRRFILFSGLVQVLLEQGKLKVETPCKHWSQNKCPLTPEFEALKQYKDSFTRKGNYAFASFCNFMLGQTYSNHSFYNPAARRYQSSLELFHKSGLKDKFYKGNIYLKLGRALWAEGYLFQEENCYIQSRKLISEETQIYNQVPFPSTFILCDSDKPIVSVKHLKARGIIARDVSRVLQYEEPLAAFIPKRLEVAYHYLIGKLSLNNGNDSGFVKHMKYAFNHTKTTYSKFLISWYISQYHSYDSNGYDSAMKYAETVNSLLTFSHLSNNNCIACGISGTKKTHSDYNLYQTQIGLFMSKLMFLESRKNNDIELQANSYTTGMFYFKNMLAHWSKRISHQDKRLIINYFRKELDILASQCVFLRNLEGVKSDFFLITEVLKNGFLSDNWKFQLYPSKKPITTRLTDDLFEKEKIIKRYMHDVVFNKIDVSEDVTDTLTGLFIYTEDLLDSIQGYDQKFNQTHFRRYVYGGSMSNLSSRIAKKLNPDEAFMSFYNSQYYGCTMIATIDGKTKDSKLTSQVVTFGNIIGDEPERAGRAGLAAQCIKSYDLFQDHENLPTLNEFEKANGFLSTMINFDSSISKTIQSKRRVYISKHGFLNMLPFETLFINDGLKEYRSFKELPYVFRKSEICHTPSIMQFINNEYQKKSGDFLFYNPDTTLFSARETRPLLEDSFRAKVISKTTKAFLMDSLDQFKYVHLSLHGAAASKYSNFGHLIVNKSAKKDIDQKLYIYNLMDMNISTHLVFTGSCESAYLLYFPFRSQNTNISAASAFHFAGAHCVIGSLWKVNDRSSAKIMKLFYQNFHRGQTTSESLRNAKLTYLNEADEIHAHPYYWAGFIQIGNPDIRYNP